MRKIIILLLTLTACSTITAKTPQQRYYALKSDYKVLLNTEVSYLRDCKTKPIEHKCNKNMEELRKINQRIDAVFEQADNAGAEMDVTKQQELLTAIKVTLAELSHYLEGLNYGE